MAEVGSSEARTWALDNGYDVGTRGTLPRTAREAYEAETGNRIVKGQKAAPSDDGDTSENTLQDEAASV